MAWNVNTEINAVFDRDVSFNVYGCGDDIIPYIRDIATAQNNAPWTAFFDWIKTHNTDCFSGNAPEAEEQAKICADIAEKLSNTDGNKAIFAHLICAANGVALLNSAKAKILQDKPTATLQSSASAWLCEYERLWTKSNKRSELDEIRKFIMKICENI